MTEPERTTSHTPETHRCGHCGNEGLFYLAATTNEVVDQEWADNPDGSSSLLWEDKAYHEFMVCPTCGGATVRSAQTTSSGYKDERPSFETVYPVAHEIPKGVPEPISSAYRAAEAVRYVDANAYGTLLGRVLELVCVEQKVEKTKLSEAVKELGRQNILPPKLVTVANKLTQHRNVGAHANQGGLSRSEVPVLRDLCNAVLAHVYEVPHLISAAEGSLARLRRKRKQD